ncbi:hypothetical protein FS764_03350 [Agrobacterium vitis]|nr:hypothetical protein [Agrobacterium vitis]
MMFLLAMLRCKPWVAAFGQTPPHYSGRGGGSTGSAADPTEWKRALGGRTPYLKEEEEEALKRAMMTHAVANPGTNSDFDHNDHAALMRGNLCLTVIRSRLDRAKTCV